MVLGVDKEDVMGKIRSRLVTYVVRAKDRETPNSDNWVQWESTLQGNRIAEDRADWLKNATPYFSDITLTRKSTAQNRKKAAIASKADIARDGLRILDELLASRKSG